MIANARNFRNDNNDNPSLPENHGPNRGETMRVWRWVVVGGIGMMIAACSSSAPAAEKPAVTQRQKDSVVGASALPGAGGVRGATAAGDSAAARNQQLDSLAKTP